MPSAAASAAAWRMSPSVSDVGMPSVITNRIRAAPALTGDGIFRVVEAIVSASENRVLPHVTMLFIPFFRAKASVVSSTSIVGVSLTPVGVV